MMDILKIFFILVLINNFSFDLEDKDNSQCYFIHKDNLEGNLSLKWRFHSKEHVNSNNLKFEIFDENKKKLETLKNKNPPYKGIDLSKYNEVKEFKICWTNGDYITKTIFFDYKTTHFKAVKEDEMEKTIENLIELKRVIGLFDNSIYSFLNKSLNHESVIKESNGNLKSFTLIKFMLFVLIVTVQIIYLKKSFSNMSKYGGII